MNRELLDEAINNMIQTDRLHRTSIDESMREIGLHRTAHRILMYLSREQNVGSQREIAEHFGITPAAATGILKNLEREGYILRQTGEDTRANYVFITDKGIATVERSKEKFRDVDSSMFEGFTDDELISYINTLKKIQTNLNTRRCKNEEMA